MKVSLQQLPFRLLAFLLVCFSLVGLNAQESERVYSMSEVTAIDRENKLWRLVDAKEGVDANVQRLLAAGVPASEVEKFKPRLIEFWGDIDPTMQIDWLDKKTVDGILELKSKYTILMRRARIDEALRRLGGDEEASMPDEIKARFHYAIWPLFDLNQRDDFRLMNSNGSIALCRLLKDLPTTASERVALCRLRQDYYRNWFPADTASRDADVRRHRKETLLTYWQQMRALLGDQRFAAYLESSDLVFGQMSFVLTQITGVSSAKVLDLWWIRKRDELDDSGKRGELARRERQTEIYDLASAVLGEDVIQTYLKDDDAKWLGKKGPPYKMPPMRVALATTEIQSNDAKFRRHQ